MNIRTHRERRVFFAEIHCRRADKDAGQEECLGLAQGGWCGTGAGESTQFSISRDQ